MVRGHIVDRWECDAKNRKKSSLMLPITAIKTIDFTYAGCRQIISTLIRW